jgi:hypothetical protein
LNRYEDLALKSAPWFFQDEIDNRGRTGSFSMPKMIAPPNQLFAAVIPYIENE